MRNEDDRAAVGAKLGKMLKQNFDLVAVERRGGFVEDDDADAFRQHLENFDDLPLIGRQVRHRCLRIDGGTERLAEAGDHGGGRGVERCAIDQAEPRQRLAAEMDILGDRHRRDQAQFLVE